MSNPLSGSNRLPISPRRSHSTLPTTAQSASITSSNYSIPFNSPSYLSHSALHSKFYTTPSPHHSSSSDDVDPNSIPLPTQWSQDDRCALLELSSDRLTASFAGSAKYGDRDAAAVRADRRIPIETGVYYFEVTIVDKGQNGYIGIGLSHRTVSLSRLPGWELNSWAWHIDDGRCFCSQGTGEPFGPMSTTGDVIGCGIDWTGVGPEKGKRERDASLSSSSSNSRRNAAAASSRNNANDKGKEKGGIGRGGRVFYTKNGTFIGYAFSNLQGPLYPTIGLRTPNESVRVNFGQEPFKFDIEALVLDRKRSIQHLFQTTPLPQPRYFLPSPLLPQIPSLFPPTERDGLHETIQSLIRGYLEHCGFEETRKSFWGQVERERRERGEGILPEDESSSSEMFGKGDKEDEKASDSTIPIGSSSAQLRSQILRLASTNQTVSAIELIESNYSTTFFDENDDGGIDEGRKIEEGGGGGDGGLEFKLRCRVFVEAVLELARRGGENGEESDYRDDELEDEEERTSSTKKKKVDRQVEGESEGEDVEMVSSSQTITTPPAPVTLDSILDLGRSLHTRYSSHPSRQVQSELQTTLGLLAYRDPIKEILGDGGDGKVVEGRAEKIVRGDERDKIVERLNRAILKASNLPPIPALEALYRQTHATVQLAVEQGSGAAALIDVGKEVLG